MENRIYDEKNCLWYEKRGDYYLPCLELSEEAQPIGIKVSKGIEEQTAFQHEVLSILGLFQTAQKLLLAKEL